MFNLSPKDEDCELQTSLDWTDIQTFEFLLHWKDKQTNRHLYFLSSCCRLGQIEAATETNSLHGKYTRWVYIFRFIFISEIYGEMRRNVKILPTKKESMVLINFQNSKEDLG